MSALSSNLVPIFQTSQKLEHTVNLFDNISIRACYGPSPAHHCSRLVLGASKQSLNKNQKHKCLVILYDSKEIQNQIAHQTVLQAGPAISKQQFT